MARDPLDFVRAQAPFDRLGSGELGRLERSLDVTCVLAGTRILSRDDPPCDHLFLVRRGVVRLEREDGLTVPMEEGEIFGYRSILSASPPAFDAVAESDTLLYRIPAGEFRALLTNPDFAGFFTPGLAPRLRKVAGPAPGDDATLSVPVGRLVTSEPLVVEPGTTVGEAARAMREARTSSVLVASGAMGILTDRDLRNRVLAEGRDASTPVEAVVSRPAVTLPADAPLLEAVLFMLERNIDHLPVERDGRVVGVVSDTDVLRHQARTPLYVLRAVEQAREPGALAGYGEELAAVVEGLSAAGVEAAAIGRVVSALNDALTRRLLRLAEERLGPSPAPYAWLVMGSEGRLEQLLLTDQDNALVHAGDDEAAAGYFAAMAGIVVEGLLAAGFPPCPGGYMATRWHGSLSRWTEAFQGWVTTPDPVALLEAAIFFDFRPVAGELDLEPLEEILDEARRSDLFLGHLAASTLSSPLALGHFGRILARDGAVDLKLGALTPLVALARVCALEAGSRARNTASRLGSAAEAGVLSRQGADNLAEAFRFLLQLRLRAQLAHRRRGRPPDHRLELATLAPIERHLLKHSLVAVRDTLGALDLRYQASRLR